MIPDTMHVTLIHNPRCSKSRKALEYLEDHGAQVTLIDYLRTPPDLHQLREILEKLEMRPRDILRSSEGAYTELGLGDPGIDEDHLLEAIISHPILLQRPIVIFDKGALIGRPPERVHSLFTR